MEERATRFEIFFLVALLVLGVALTLCSPPPPWKSEAPLPEVRPAVWTGNPEPFPWGLWGHHWKHELKLPPEEA